MNVAWRLVRLAVPALVAAGTACSGPTAPAYDAGTDTASEVDMGPPPPCSPRTTQDFVLGIVEIEDPRAFQPFDDECRSIEVQSGIQGGWHIEPALQAPSDAVVPDLGGEMTWRIFDADGEPLSNESRFEMFKPFWQDLGGGYAYWGDFVIFDGYPEDAIDGEITIELALDFNDESSLEDRTIREVVVLRDEVSEWTPP